MPSTIKHHHGPEYFNICHTSQFLGLSLTFQLYLVSEEPLSMKILIYNVKIFTEKLLSTKNIMTG